MFFFLFSAKRAFSLCFIVILAPCKTSSASSSRLHHLHPLIYIIRCKPFRGCTGASSFFKGASRSASPLKMLAPCFKAASASRCLQGFKAASSFKPFSSPSRAFLSSRVHLIILHPLKPFEALCRVQGCIICICCIIFKASSSESPARVHLLSCCICFICFICFIFFLVSCRLAGLAPASRLHHLHLLSCIIICKAASASAFLQALAPCFKGASVSSSSASSSASASRCFKAASSFKPFSSPSRAFLSSLVHLIILHPLKPLKAPCRASRLHLVIMLHFSLLLSSFLYLHHSYILYHRK